MLSVGSIEKNIRTTNRITILFSLFAHFLLYFLPEIRAGDRFHLYNLGIKSGYFDVDNTFSPENDVGLKYNRNLFLDYILENLDISNRKEGK